MSLISHFRYLGYVIRHKWYVFVECCRLGIPYRGLVHDLSKFRPSEWFAYVNQFYGPKPPETERTGYCHKVGNNEKFDLAWLKHQKRNPHHWQWWIVDIVPVTTATPHLATTDTVHTTEAVRFDGCSVKVLPMPDKYRREMLADWRGAGKAQGNGSPNECKTWYMKNHLKMQLHPDTRKWIEEQLGVET